MPIGLKGNSDGSGAIQIGGSDAISISTGLNTTFAGTVTATGTVAGTTGTLYPIVSGTAVASTSGTSIDFTGIPSWVKRITVMLSGVSTNGTSIMQIQIGAGSVSTSGYSSTVTGAAATVATATSTTGFPLYVSGIAATSSNVSTNMQICLLGSNTWVASFAGAVNTSASYGAFGGGTITLSGTLDRVRITTVNGTDAFDAGTINILYE